MYKQKLLVSGGTFDHFHKGHKAFIDMQLAISEKVLIGITSDRFAKQKEEGLEPYEIRMKQVKDYIASKGAHERVEIAQIEDGYIPPVWDTYPIEAIAVTPDTTKGADSINTRRQEQGLAVLTLYTISEKRGGDGKIISSKRIRQGEIDREGVPFVDPLWEKQTLHLPDFLRAEIAKPFGEVFTDFSALLAFTKLDANRLIVVGDVVTESFQKVAYGQKVSIVDLYINRKKHYGTVKDHTMQGDEQILHVHNPAGCITPELFSGVKKSIFENERYIVLVEGEEDLAVLPCMLFAPLGFSVVYGQPERGIVFISVTETKKQDAKKLLEKFTLLASK